MRSEIFQKIWFFSTKYKFLDVKILIFVFQSWQVCAAAAACMVAPVTVAAAHPQGTLKGTSTCSSHGGAASYETFIASLRNLNVKYCCVSHIKQDLGSFKIMNSDKFH